MAEALSREVFVTMGSNIEPVANLERALERLRRELEVEVEAVSGVWESEPHGAPGTPRFLNAAVRLRSELPLDRLKRLLRRIEADLGRRRSADRNAPRTIDLDIALIGDLVLDDPSIGLEVPDPEILERGYLALPLAEVGPGVRHPASGELLTEVAGRLAAAADAPLKVAARLGSVRRRGR